MLLQGEPWSAAAFDAPPMKVLCTSDMGEVGELLYNLYINGDDDDCGGGGGGDDFDLTSLLSCVIEGSSPLPPTNPSSSSASSTIGSSERERLNNLSLFTATSFIVSKLLLLLPSFVNDDVEDSAQPC